MSSSSIEREPASFTFWAYWSERVPSTLFLPVAVLLASPALPLSAAFAKSVLLAYLLVFQFRLWDDLIDREKDRVSHPERVLSRAGSLTPFRILLVALAVAIVLLLPWRMATAYLLAVAAFELWYRWIARKLPEIVRYHVVLLKYPLFSLLAAGAGFTAMAFLYLTFVLYEPLHDRRLGSLPEVRAAVAVEMFLWAALAIVVVAGPAVPIWAAYLLAIAAAAAAIVELRRFWASSESALAGRAVFLVSLASLVFASGVAS